jgi:hypothetical protein
MRSNYVYKFELENLHIHNFKALNFNLISCQALTKKLQQSWRFELVFPNVAGTDIYTLYRHFVRKPLMLLRISSSTYSLPRYVHPLIMSSAFLNFYTMMYRYCKLNVHLHDLSPVLMISTREFTELIESTSNPDSPYHPSRADKPGFADTEIHEAPSSETIISKKRKLDDATEDKSSASASTMALPKFREFISSNKHNYGLYQNLKKHVEELAEYCVRHFCCNNILSMIPN